MPTECDHSGPHSGALRYQQALGQLRLLLVCDGCGAERGELGRQSYQPEARLDALAAGARNQ
jgi:hypothetical protein